MREDHGTGAGAGPARPLATFAHVSDLHLGQETEGPFAQAARRTACLLEDLRHGPRSQWLVVGGDLTHRGSVDPQALRDARQALDALGVPYNCVPGNHDLCPSPDQAARFPGVERYEPVPLEDTAYGRTFGPPGLRWRRVLGGVEFVGVALRAGDPDGELSRLRGVLGSPTAVRARIVVGHYPTLPVRTAGPLAAWGPGHLGRTAAEVEGVLAEAASWEPPVVAYLFGHVHVLCATRRGGVWHATPGAVGAGCPGYRWCEVWPDRIETRFVPLSDPDLAACGFWSTGRPGACTDAEHADYQVYHAGTARERAFCIPLQVARPWG